MGWVDWLGSGTPGSWTDKAGDVGRHVWNGLKKVGEIITAPLKWYGQGATERLLNGTSLPGDRTASTRLHSGLDKEDWFKQVEQHEPVTVIGRGPDGKFIYG
jgi:hypothetical protein